MMVSKALPILCLLLTFGPWPGGEKTPSALQSPEAPEMPDESHRLLAEHAAGSHGLPVTLAGWIAQGAWDEDHCEFEPYPPCLWWIPNGWHSWDPDTGGYWELPVWEDEGSGLTRADRLFALAVEANAANDTEAAYLYLGRAVHMLGDMATPAHVHLDTHLPPLDMDPYEMWLNEGDLANTKAWITQHPPSPQWSLDHRNLPAWADLDPDLQGQLDGASQVYGNRSSGKELWLLGPEDHDAIVFRLMFLMAEEADNWDSGDVSGEQHPGDLDDPAYLNQMRDTLFPKLVQYSAALIDYFEDITAIEPQNAVFLPLLRKESRLRTTSSSIP